LGANLEGPVPPVTAKDHTALVMSHLVKLKGTNIGHRANEPVQTITAGGLHFGEVRAFLQEYCGGEGVTTVTAYGQHYEIIDIGMRMLEPYELFAAQGFPVDYIIDRDHTGNRYSKAAQVTRCGNAVPPPFAEALTKANLPELCSVGSRFGVFEDTAKEGIS